MPFTPEQTSKLSAKLDSSHVKKRAQAGRQLSYIEGWFAISEANRIFGFDGWHRETVELKEIHLPHQNDRSNWVVGYMARVRVTVGEVIREGCGFGSGIDKDLGRAHESAIKEAETDAMKRALMTFGNPFGLALYDKEQTNVETNGRADGATNTPGNGDPKALFIVRAKEIAAAFGDANSLAAWWRSHEQKAARKDFGLSQSEIDEIKAVVTKRIAELGGETKKDAA